MKKALLAEPGRFEVREEALTEPDPGKVRIRVRAAGICGTDIEVYKGNFPSGWNVVFPFQLGHELSGTVDAVGAGVPETFKTGDRVVPDGRIPCGYCSFCRRGQVNACEYMGYFSGGFREYSNYRYQSLVRIPDAVGYREAAMAEPISCTMYGNAKLNVEVGNFAVVIGEGAIGLLHAQLLRNRGAEVAVVGLLENRLKLAEKLDVDHVVNAKKTDPVEEIFRLTNGRGADQVVMAAGAEIVLKQALSMAGRNGQVLYFAANMKESCTLPMDVIHYKELKVIGSYDSTTAYFEKALRAISMGRIDAESLISHTFSLEDIGKAFELAVAGEGMKIMITDKE